MRLQCYIAAVLNSITEIQRHCCG